MSGRVLSNSGQTTSADEKIPGGRAVMPSYLVSALVATMISTQAASPPPASSNTAKGSKTPTTLSGCVSQVAQTPGSFTLSDTTTGARYRLSGVGMRKYAGQR